MFYKETVLDNGITVITESMPDVRSITMGFWFQVGSRDETSAQAGMSHFMEHMMFKGTPSRDAMQISSAFESLGAELNAFTSREYTCYYARFVDEKLSQAFELMSDMVVNSLFEQECIDSEREVVIEEIARSEDTPDDYVWDLFSDTLMPTHPLGRPVIGTREIVGQFDHDNCRAYHDAHYSTGNLVLALAGNVDHEEVVALCTTYLSDMPAAPRTVRPQSSENEYRPYRFLTKDTEQSHLLFGMPAYPAGHPDRFAVSLLDCALGGGMSSRLFQEVREKRGLAYAVYCQTCNHTDAGEFAIYAGTRPSNLEEVVDIIRREIDKVVRDNITKGELERVRDFAIGQFILGMESTRTRMSRLGKMAIMGQEQQSIDEVIAAYRAVTLDDTARVANSVLTAPATVAVISPYDESELKKMFV